MANSNPAQQARLLSSRLFTASLGAAELMVVYLGERLGLYRALAEGPATAGELAARADIGVRYAREWLEQQAASGIVEVEDVVAEPLSRRFVLPEGHRRALTDHTGPMSVLPLAVLPVAGIAPALPLLAEAYRSGEGLEYSDYGDELRVAQTGMNRPIFEHELARWVRTALPDVHALLSRPGAAVADVGCGVGWSSIALARAYPMARVDGFELSSGLVAEAGANAVTAGVTGRITFAAGRVGELGEPGGYQLVCVFDALHDMGDPVGVLRECREVLGDGGCVLLMEPRGGEEFSAPADDVERFLYAVSVLHCLPVGMGEGSVGSGAVLRPEVVRGYAEEAGFRMTVLPVEHRFHRLYRLDAR